MFCRCSGKVQEVENVVNESLFSALCKIFTGCYFNGTIIHLFYKKKTAVTYPIKTVHQARKLGTRKLNKRDRPNPLAPYFYFVLFIFISVFLVSSLYGVRKS